MSDRRNEPDSTQQPPLTQNPTDLSNQPALRNAKPTRWLVTAGIMAAVAVVLFAFSLELQIALPVIGIVFAVVMWIVMFIVARSVHQARRRNLTLAWLMIALALGSLLIIMGVYVVEVMKAVP